MTQQFHEHFALEGQRLDTIAFVFFRDAFGYLEILKFNPQYQGRLSLKAGDRVLIPKKSTQELRIKSQNLPPWK
ncbi:MAG: hypothetical protein J7647_26165 [Cyanobacteria bacterium SBLK]|nr:hypothetical protein [Cyanobacteria bacterium SBLK]